MRPRKQVSGEANRDTNVRHSRGGDPKPEDTCDERNSMGVFFLTLEKVKQKTVTFPNYAVKNILGHFIGKVHMDILKP